MMQSSLGMSRQKKMENWTAWCFLIPSLLGFTVYYLIPIVLGLSMSFTDFASVTSPFQFVGLSNFRRLMTDRYVSTSFRNNLIYMLIFTPATLAISLLLALALNRAARGRKLYRVCFFLPYITSMVAVAVIWRLLLNPTNGPINVILRTIGVQSPPKWLLSVDSALYAIILVSVWKQFGYYMIILLAGLQAVPSYLNESAVIDGANSFQRFCHVTVPMLSPTLFLCLIMLVISSFQVFDLVSVLTNGGPGMATMVLVLRIYTEAFKYGHLAYSSAISVFLFLIVLVITALQFLGQKYWVHYE